MGRLLKLRSITKRSSGEWFEARRNNLAGSCAITPKESSFFVRPFVRARVEKVACAREVFEINGGLLVEIKNKEMPK